MTVFQEAINALTEEKEKLEQKISQHELEKTDIENKLIQEKLKHHQTQSDLQKTKETLTAAQKDLNEEIENRKEDLRKIEDLKRQLFESEKKGKEYKKSMKRLSQQVLDFQNKIHNENKEKEKQLTLTATTEPQSLERFETETLQSKFLIFKLILTLKLANDEINEKAKIISDQYQKINELQEGLEKVSNEATKLIQENKTLKEVKQLKIILNIQRDKKN